MSKRVHRFFFPVRKIDKVFFFWRSNLIILFSFLFIYLLTKSFIKDFFFPVKKKKILKRACICKERL